MLTRNMRLQGGVESINASKLEDFSQWILNIGDKRLS